MKQREVISTKIQKKIIVLNLQERYLWNNAKQDGSSRFWNICGSGKKLARNRKGKTIESQRRLETFRSLTRVKRKPRKKKDFVADVKRLIKCTLHMLRLAQPSLARREDGLLRKGPLLFPCGTS